MRPSLIPVPPSEAPSALVLGPEELGEILVSQFEALGIAAEYEPAPEDVSGLEKLLAEVAARPGRGARFIHPGLSAWADRPEFAQIVQAQGLVAVCPPSRVMSLFLNRINFLSEADAQGLATLVSGFDPLSSLREIQAVIAKSALKFPLVLKSVRSGPSGVHLVRTPEELDRMVPLWLDQLSRTHGEASVFLERALPAARHVIVPFAAFPDRRVLLPWIDASLQSRWRRMIQFCPATNLDAEAIRAVEDACERLLVATGFVGVGSLEFLVDGRRAYLIDGLARMSAAFPLTDRVTGISSVQWQLAALGAIPAPELPAELVFKSALSLRLYAEDPVRQIPTPGWIHEITEPRGWDLASAQARLITSFRPGQAMSPDHTGVLGELFVFGQERKQAIQAARSALEDVWVSGSIQTNQRFMIEHLEHPFVRENLIHAGFTDEEFIPQTWPEPLILKRMVTLAANLFGESPIPQAKGGAEKWVAGQQWVDVDVQPVQFVIGPDRFPFEGRPGATGIARFADFTQARFCAFPTGDERWMIRLGIWSVTVRRVRPGGAPRATGSKERKLVAMAAGTVHALLAREGAETAAHDPVLVLESLRTLVPHAIALKVKVVRWLVTTGQRVEQGQELAVLELLG